LISDDEELKRRVSDGDQMIAGSSVLAPVIGLLAEKSADGGRLSDIVTLDANYVRRSDAEIFWKEPSARAG
jgi:hypothetical protein